MFFDSSLSIGEIIKNNNIQFAYTLYHSSTLASLNLVNLKTYGYLIKIPQYLKRGSLYLNLYKPKNLYEFIFIKNVKYVLLKHESLYKIYVSNH